MNRLHQSILITSTILGSWLGMQAVHELGHILGAWLTSGQVSQVVLNPLTISRTDLSHNPYPLIVVWSDPIVGITIPIILWAVATIIRLPIAFVLRFFAGFCLLANGLYIGLGSFDRIGDCGEMVRHGSPMWHLWVFGIITVFCGSWLWHGQGPNFGLSSAKGQVNRKVAYISLIACVSLIVLGFAVGGE